MELDDVFASVAARAGHEDGETVVGAVAVGILHLPAEELPCGVRRKRSPAAPNAIADRQGIAAGEAKNGDAAPHAGGEGCDGVCCVVDDELPKNSAAQ